LILTGKLSVECELQLIERPRAGDELIATWRLRPRTATHVEGTRAEPAGASVKSIVLDTARSFECDTHGPWTKFASPDWPITFEYPSSWSIDRDDEGDLVIECPDPERLSYGGDEIWLHHDVGDGAEYTLESGAVVREFDGFMRHRSGKWLYDAGGSCNDPPNPDSLFCEEPTRSRRNGLTILRATAGEHRLYLPGGGYLGQGGGLAKYLFLVGSNWVRLTGPDGDPVTERVAGSIRSARKP
jgi:hypothetical protein